MILFFIWRGYGFLVPLVTFGFLLLIESATRLMIKEEFYYQAHGWPQLLGACLAAAVIYPVAKHYDSRPDRTLIDQNTGKEVVLRTKNSFVFIPMRYWPFVLLVIGVYFFVHTDRPNQTLGNDTAIEKETFSMTLPKGWTEDTKDGVHDSKAFLNFQGPRTCLFAVLVGKESAGATVEDLLKWQNKSWEKELTNTRFTGIKAWSKYQGNGFELEGKLQGGIRFRTRAFGFQQGDNVCLVVESGALGDLEIFADDWEKIRETFKLK